MPNGDLDFTDDELRRLEKARQLVSAPDFHLKTTDFVNILVLQGVDEILGVNDALYRERRKS